jgi:mono/diheme cytochrome c family protein
MKRKTWKILAVIPTLGLLLSTGAAADEPPKMPYVFGMYCFMCHKEKVQIGPIGMFDMKSKEGNELHPEYIRNNTRFGYNAMPAFRLSEISEKELEEIVAYLRALADYRKTNPGYQPTEN